MPFKLGVPELTIILLIALVLFGSSRIGSLGKELGSAIRGFREEVGATEEPEMHS